MTEYLKLIIASFIGAFFSILVQAYLLKRKKSKIKKAISTFLNDVVIEGCELMKKEIGIIRNDILIYDYNSLTLDMHPTMNARLLKSFNIEDLQSIYKKELTELIVIISLLDNLETRKPYMMKDEFIKATQEHIRKNKTENNTSYNSDKEHFNNCNHIKSITKHMNSNLDNVLATVDCLLRNINALK